MITEQTVVRRIEGLLAKASAPWCVQCHQRMRHNGFDRHGNERWICELCFAGYGVRHRDVLKARAVELFQKGHSARGVAKLVGIVQRTSEKYRREAQASVCQCGQDSKHQGWCWWRYQQSPKRQEFIRQWHHRSAR